MPNSTRQWARRKLDQSRNNLNWTGGHLNEVATTYQKEHPEISGPIETCLQLLLQVDTLIEQIKDLI